MRNYDIVPTPLDQLQYSAYVNTILYSYYIQDYCTAPPGGAPLSEAVEIPVDVLANASRYAPVSAIMEDILDVGGFYNGLTRDDVAGLRYLYRANHVHWEDVPTNSIVFFTNNIPTALTNIVTTNLSLLIAQSFTNDDNTLQALYPTLAIVPGSTVPTFTNVVTTNLTGYYTNSPWDPIGTPPHLVYLTNYTTNASFIYTRAFANVVTNSYSPKTYVTVISTNVYFPPSGPVGYYTTNITTTTMATNQPSGDYYIIPTTLCGVQILSNILTTVVGVTNIVTSTNNVTTNTISGNYLIGQSYVYWSTNHNLAAYQVLCVSNEPSLRRGIEKITFAKSAYDSLIGRFYAPETNYFTMTVVTNSTNWVQTYQRVVTTPDILFTARDGMPGPAQPLNAGTGPVTRDIALNSANALPNLAGPGVIEPVTTITFNKSGPILFNEVTNNLWSMDQRTSVPFNFMWATFDDSTNPPVVYPNGTSLASVESQMLMQVTSISLPPAQVNAPYSTQLTGTGGSGPPYKWELEPLDGNILPVGLSLTGTGILSGTPAATGIYSFFVRMDDRSDTSPDMSQVFTVWQVTITVLP